MDTPTETPRVNAHVTATTAVFKTVDGRSEVLEATGDGLRDVVVDRALREAIELGTTVELVTTGERGEHRILARPDGTLTAVTPDVLPTRSVLREQTWWMTGPPAFVDDTASAPVEPAELDPTPEPAPAEPVATEPLVIAEAVPAPVGFPDLSDLSPDAPDVAAPADTEDEPDIFRLLASESDDDAPEDDVITGLPAMDEPVAADVVPTPDFEPASTQPESPRGPESAEFSLPQPAPENPYTGPHPIDPTPSDEPSARPSFITPAVGQPKPITGWRGFLARIGLPVGPSRAQLERAGWEQEVALQWAGCRTIAVANGKGGVGKTMTTAMLAAVFARVGGGNVLAWDNNDTRGTLGWRTEQGLYDTTLRDLLPEAARLLEPTSSVSEIARFVHHQAADRYDVLRSNPELLATDQRIATADFDLLMQVAARYYRLVIFDSGNDESADRWLRMIDSSYQLVVPTLAAPESAESAALLLDALRRRDEHSKRLADEATVIVSQSERSSLAAVSAIAEKFAGHVRAVEIIPFDHGLKSGPLRFDGLQSATRDAWTRAGAAVARGL